MRARCIVGEAAVLITDNQSHSNLKLLDERVAIALAVVESANEFSPDSGTLVEVVSTFNLACDRWLYLDTIELPMPLVRPPWCYLIPSLSRRNWKLTHTEA